MLYYLRENYTKNTKRFILQSEKERRSKTIEAITDGFWEWDMTKNELYISPKYKEFLGNGGQVHQEIVRNPDGSVESTGGFLNWFKKK